MVELGDISVDNSNPSWKPLDWSLYWTLVWQTTSCFYSPTWSQSILYRTREPRRWSPARTWVSGSGMPRRVFLVLCEANLHFSFFSHSRAMRTLKRDWYWCLDLAVWGLKSLSDRKLTKSSSGGRWRRLAPARAPCQTSNTQSLLWSVDSTR